MFYWRGGLANQLSDVSGYIQDIYLQNNLCHSAVQQLLTSLFPSITRPHRNNMRKWHERGCLRFLAIHFVNSTSCLRNHTDPFDFSTALPRLSDQKIGMKCYLILLKIFLKIILRPCKINLLMYFFFCIISNDISSMT